MVRLARHPRGPGSRLNTPLLEIRRMPYRSRWARDALFFLILNARVSPKAKRLSPTSTPTTVNCIFLGSVRSLPGTGLSELATLILKAGRHLKKKKTIHTLCFTENWLFKNSCGISLFGVCPGGRCRGCCYCGSLCFRLIGSGFCFVATRLQRSGQFTGRQRSCH